MKVYLFFKDKGKTKTIKLKIKFYILKFIKNTRLVNEALKEEMNEIHALTQKCVTPEQWEKMLVENPDLANQNQVQKPADPTKKCDLHQH